ncbi:MAG: 50S ribosomal protein L22 [Acidimicrobiia bacterium]
MPETKATLRYLRTSAYKVREVLALVRGLPVDEARHVLQFCERSVAREVLKVLNSAVANAEHTLDLPADELFGSVAYADEGPTITRWRPRARGRATRIRKRTSHITIIVARFSDEQLQARRRKEAAQPGRRRGVLPRRRRGEDKPAAGKAPKGKAAPAAAPEETVEEAPVAEAEPAPVAEAEVAAVEDEAPVAAEETAEEKAARYATLGRDEGPAAGDEAATESDEEEGSS